MFIYMPKSQMALITSSVRCLVIASGSTQSPPFKLGLILLSSRRHQSFLHSTRTALSGFSASPRYSWNQRHLSFQSSAGPRRLLHHNGQQLMMARRVTPSSPRISLHGTQRLRSETSDKGDPSTFPRDILVGIAFSSGACLLYWIVHSYGRAKGAQDLGDRLPHAKILAEREALDFEEGWLEFCYGQDEVTHCKYCGECRRLYNLHNDTLGKVKKALAEKEEALDKRELEQLRQRTMALEEKQERQKTSVDETDRETSLETIDAGALPVGLRPVTCPSCRERMNEGSSRGTIQPSSRNFRVLIPGVAHPATRIEKEPHGPPQHASTAASASVEPHVPTEAPETNGTLKSVPHPHDDATSHTKPDTNPTGPDANPTNPPTTKKAPPTPAPSTPLPSLSADQNATDSELSLIKRAHEALEDRERALKARCKDQKKRIQALSAPEVWSVVLLGSALALGVASMAFGDGR